MALELNGTRVAIVTEPMVIDAGAIACEASPPCSGSCGTGSHRGGAVSLLCYKDGSCTPEFCDCDCGWWIVSEFDHQALQPGDEITIILYPAPGALPEGETGDDQKVTNCDPYLWWDCACFAGWLSVFPGVGLSPGDEITVILYYPAPGSLPELPGTDGDDEAGVSCCPTVAVGEAESAAAAAKPWRLGQNRPNPASPLTAIAFDLARGGVARVEVIDASGRHVRTLLERTLAAGTWSVTWDGRTAGGRPAASGTYFYRLALDGRSETRRMVLLSAR